MTRIYYNNDYKSSWASRRQKPKRSDGEQEVHSEWGEKGKKKKERRGRGRDLTLMSGSGQPTRAEDRRREGEREGRDGRRRGGGVGSCTVDQIA